jgi:hypothetical protein
LTPAQKTQRKAISEQAFNCILNARKAYRSDDRRYQQAVQQRKSQRDQQYAALQAPQKSMVAAKAARK